MLLPMSICVCIPCFKLVSPWFCLAKVIFFVSFKPDINTKISMVIYMYSQCQFVYAIHVLQISPDYIVS